MAVFFLRPARLAGALLALSLCSLGTAAPAAAAEAKRRITETDLFHFVWVADPQISPDGKRVAFVRVTVNAKKDGYDTAIWLTATDGSEPARPFTAGPTDASPRWSPDGRRLAFVRSPDKESKPQIYWLEAAGGGEARALTDLPGGAGDPVWSPDGKSLAFSSGTNAEDLAKKQKKNKKDEEEYESDVRVITRAAFRWNGGGYVDLRHPAHIWTVALPTDPSAAKPEPVQVTRGDLDDGPPQWSADGKSLYFVANRDPEPYYKPSRSALYAVPAGGGEPVLQAEVAGGINELTLAPDGRKAALIAALEAEPERSYNQPDLLLLDLAGTAQGGRREAQNLTAGYDFDIGANLTGDQHPPRGGYGFAPVWSRDQKTLYTVAIERGRGNLMKVDAATGKVTPLTAGDQEVYSFTATPDASRFALAISTPTAIGDLWSLDAASGKLTQITRFNEPLFSRLDLTTPQEIVYKSFDGREIQAWVQAPPDFDPKKKYPLILNIHGGPHAAYGWVFDHEFQWMAAEGYLVLYPNPRGSTSYGQEFGNVIQYHYPGDDVQDLLAGVDELVKRGWADPKRLGVTGGSGGGILTNWIVTQTDRFAAAVAQRSISDWTSFWYTADFTQFTPSWFRGAPWEDPQDFQARSPITHIEKVKTPLMLIEGEADYRTPPTAGGELMFRALKYLKKPTVMVRFPDESHELSRSGKPWHRIERLRHLVGWFDKYLLGKKVEGYDVP